MNMFIQALDAIRVSNSADMITADHLQVALVEEDFKKAWDLKTVAQSPSCAGAGVCAGVALID